MKLLGIDFGTKKIGLAIGDSEIKIAIPLLNFFYKKQEEALNILKEIILNEKINKIIIGLPLSMDFQETKISNKSKEFGKKLKKEFNLKIDFENEILSSHQARQQEYEKFRKIKTRKQTRENLIDSKAATIILQSYFDKN